MLSYKHRWNMESVEKTIKNYNLLKSGETIGVAVSGGVDSMCLLHYLFATKQKYGVDIVALNVDHQIRDNSAEDSKFVEDFCKKLGIPCFCFRVDVPKIASEKKLGLEESARIARYKIFDEAIKKGLCDKVAIAHHEADQVETVLLNIFRGAGLKGAGGMNPIQEKYIRPFLFVSKAEILKYAEENNFQYVVDQTNADSTYSRNFLRNEILPELRKYWKNIDGNIINFSNICKQDDLFIESQIDFDDILFEGKTARIPLYKFAYPESVQNRVLRYAFQKLGLSKDIEKRHLGILKSLISSGQNGSKISLPNKLRASLEYDELVLCVPKAKKQFVPKDFKKGKTIFENFVINVKKTSNFDVKAPNTHIIDAKKLPQDAKWRARQNGDVFAKFGSGEKKLKDYFIDKKIPNSQRDQIPVLASNNQVFCVLGYEISDKVKADQNTKQVWAIEYKKI